MNPTEQLELDAADPEVALPASRVVAVLADRASAFSALRKLRFRFGLVADTADHHAPVHGGPARLPEGQSERMS